MVWGFNSRDDALKAKQLVRERPPTTKALRYVEGKFEQWLLLTPSGGIPPRSGNTAGKAECDVMEIIGGTMSVMTELDRIETYNITDEQAPENTIIACWMINGVPVWQGSGGTGAPPWIRFTTTGKIADRVVQGNVDDVPDGLVHEPGHPKEGQPIERGDSLTFHDPTNMWGEIEANATGTAYMRTLPEENARRWEIEDCSLPINLIRGKLTQCLKYSDLQATVVFGSASQPPVSDWILSSYNNCDMPPEVVEASLNDYAIVADNTFKLDAGTGAIVTIRRQTNVEISDPGNLDVPKGSSATTARWEIAEVFEQKARWTQWTWVGSSQAATLDAFWEGADPRLCSPAPTLNHVFDTECLDQGDKIIACYRPEQDDYVSVSTQSALYGPGAPYEVLIEQLSFKGSACQLEYKKIPTKLFCTPEITLPTVAVAPSTTVRSLDSVYVSGTEVCIAYTDYVVPLCDIGGYGADCVDICPIICQCPELYSKPEICGPPPCKDINCIWEWQGGDAPAGNWVQITDCPEQNPDCECEDQNTPPFTGDEKEGDRVVRDCIEPPRTCCDEPTGTEVVTNLVGDGDSIQFSLTNAGTMNTSGGGCSGSVTGMLVDVWDPGDPGNVCTANATATLGWDANANDCLWEVFVDACDAFPGFSFKVVGCAGANCTDVPGDCNGLNNALFETTWTGSCSDPGGVLNVRAIRMMSTDQPTARKLLEAPESSSLGTSFKTRHESLFVGCGCKKDVIAVMNRWTSGEVTNQQIQRVVDTMASKNKDIDKAALFGLIKEHVS